MTYMHSMSNGFLTLNVETMKMKFSKQYSKMQIKISHQSSVKTKILKNPGVFM